MNQTPTRLPQPSNTPPSQAPPAMIRFACPECGKACLAKASAAGQTATCRSCNGPLTIPRPAATPKKQGPKKQGPKKRGTKTQAPSGKSPKEPLASAKRRAPLANAERLTITCTHCATRFDVAARRLGEQIDCPDCGVMNVARAAEAKPKTKPPAALDGDQYEVFEGENQPWAQDLIARQRKLVPVACRLCGTRMSVPTTAIGKRVACPDCGTKTGVEAPVAEPKPATERVVVDDDDLEVEAAPETTLAPITQQDYLTAPRAGSWRKESDADAPAVEDRSYRKPPRGVLYRRLFACWKSPGLIATWIVYATISLVALRLLMGGGGAGGGGIVSIGLGAIATVLLLVVVLGLSLLLAGIGAKILMELLSEASVGSHRIRNWPTTDATEWGGPLLMLVVAYLTSIAPMLLLSRFFDAPPAWAFELVACVALPIVLLSQLEVGSPWGIVSPAVLRSLAVAPIAWLTFYLLSYPLACGADRLMEFAQGLGAPGWLYLLVPLDLLGHFTYFHLIGLLAWVLEDATQQGGSSTPEARRL